MIVRHRLVGSLVRALAAAAALAVTLAAQPVQDPPRREVPDPTALQRAAPATQRALTDRILALAGDIGQAQQQLQIAAFAQPDSAVRYLLLTEGIALAERAGDATQALVGVDALATHFEVDAERLGVAAFDRMRRTADAAAATSMAVAALQRARQHVGVADDHAMLAWFEQALRAAVATADAPLHDYVRDQLPVLRALHGWWNAPTDDLTTAQLGERRTVLASFLRGSHAYATLPFTALAPFVAELPEALAHLRIDDVAAETVRDLAPLARDTTIRRGLLRGAQSALASEWPEAGDERRREIAAALTGLCGELATAPGITALRFRHANQLEGLVRSNGKWSIEHGLLVGRCDGVDNFATHRYAFRAVRTVVIRGGIRSAEGLNFRCKVGDVNLLLNWEVRDENHLWHRGTCDARGPRALTAGQEHVIALVATPGAVQVLLDGELWWSTPGTLDGTVTVYPALGSEIFVREILIDGEPERRVTGPHGTCM